MLFTWRFELGIVNVDMVVFTFAFAMLMIGLRVGISCVGLKCRAARWREFINSGWVRPYGPQLGGFRIGNLVCEYF
jgi:hypothetical protein